MSACASVTHERALETREPSYVSRAAMPFFISVVHTWQHRSSPLRKVEPRAVGHVAAPELPSQEGRARSPGTRGSVGAHLSKEARSGAAGHVAAPELTSPRMRGSALRDTWRRRSSPQQGGEVWGHGTRGGSRAHFCWEAWSEATTYMAARGCTLCTLS
jgi:hypothetical protein